MDKHIRHWAMAEILDWQTRRVTDLFTVEDQDAALEDLVERIWIVFSTHHAYREEKA